MTFGQTNVLINGNIKLNVGLNALSKRLGSLNGLIGLDWRNENYYKYKLNCKAAVLNVHLG
jgi:hypothetical protein